ncbi:MAG: hypothetical protein IT238_00630 [Bacteroidia bacterium]|nr:hypothetical protein [Bacteroidia bacterium]
MKNLTKAALAILVVASSFTACKKGDDDPGLSLKSRKGRIAREWKVSDYTTDVTDVTTYNGTTTSTRTLNTKLTYSGNSAKREVVDTQAGGGVTSTETDVYTGTVSDFSYTFEKDGTWSSTSTIKWTSVTSTSGGTTSTDAVDITEVVTQSGIWYFLGKNKTTEDKNKESLLLSITKEQYKYDSKSTSGGNYAYSSDDTYTYANNENTEVIHLSRLAKDEIVGDGTVDNSYNGSSSSTSGGTTTTTKYGPNTGKGTISLKLAAK